MFLVLILFNPMRNYYARDFVIEHLCIQVGEMCGGEQRSKAFF